MNVWAFIERSRKRITRFAQRLRHYSDYRSLGQGVAEAWEKSGRTL